jgi:hypothetical protein
MDAQAILNKLSQSVHLHHQQVKSPQNALYLNERLSILQISVIGGVWMNFQLQTRF